MQNLCWYLRCCLMIPTLISGSRVWSAVSSRVCYYKKQRIGMALKEGKSYPHDNPLFYISRLFLSVVLPELYLSFSASDDWPLGHWGAWLKVWRGLSMRSSAPLGLSRAELFKSTHSMVRLSAIESVLSLTFKVDPNIINHLVFS